MTKSIRHICVVMLYLINCGAASATGFFVNQQSVRGLGRVDAGNTVAADELGTIFFNAAGLTEFLAESPGPNFRASYGLHLIISSVEIKNTGSVAATPGTLGKLVPFDGKNAKDPGNPAPIPNIYLAARLSPRLALGAAINVPFGLSTYPGNNWFGRYDASKARLTTVNVSLVAAYEVIPDSLSVGGGVDVQYAETKLVTAIPDPLAPGGPSIATDGLLEGIGHTWTPGFNVGLLYTLVPDALLPGRTRIGVHYRSGMTHSISGSATFSGLTGPLAAFNGKVGSETDLRLPAIATIGISQQVASVVLLGEFGWYGWSTLDENRVHFANGQQDLVRPQHYRDAYAVAIGAEYPVPDSPLSFRGGIHYDTTPTVDAYRDTTFADSERVWLGVGATYRISDHWNLDFAYNHVFFGHTKVGITRTFFDGTPLASAIRINGAVQAAVDTVAFDAHFMF